MIKEREFWECEVIINLEDEFDENEEYDRYKEYGDEDYE